MTQTTTTPNPKVVTLKTVLNPDGTVKHGVRLAFPNLFEADEGRYSIAIIVPPDHPQLSEIRAAMIVVAKDKWKDKAEQQFKALEKSDKLALHDGDTKAQYAGYAGNLFINAARQEKDGPPLVIGADKMPLTAKSGKPYSGCYINVSLEFWGQLAGTGKDGNPMPARINAGLRGVQFVKDGESFGGATVASSDEFDAVAGTEAGDFA